MKFLETEYERIGRVTICRLYARWRGEDLIFRGVAIRHPDDKQNIAVGELLAWQRAHEKALKRVARWTEGQIKLAEHNANIIHKPFGDYLTEIAIPEQAEYDRQAERKIVMADDPAFAPVVSPDPTVRSDRTQKWEEVARTLSRPETRKDTFGRIRRLGRNKI